MDNRIDRITDNKVNRKLIMIIFGFLLGSLIFLLLNNPIVFAARDGAYDLFAPSANQLLSFIPGVSPLSQDRLMGLFYPIYQWEMNTCSQGLTSDKKKPPIDTATTDVTALLYAPITGTIQAKRFDYGDSSKLYEVSWYVQPKNSEIKYSVYLKQGSNKEYIAESISADPAQGDTGYYAKYLNESYNRAVIDYDSGTLEVLINITK